MDEGIGRAERHDSAVGAAFDRPALAAGTHLTAGPKAPDRTIDIEILQSYCDLEYEFLVS